MRRQAATVDEVIFDFLRHEADGPAQLDEGKSFLAQIEDGLEANPEKRSDFFRRPELSIRRWLIRFPGKRLSTGRAGHRWRIHRDDFVIDSENAVKAMWVLGGGNVQEMRARLKIASKLRPELTLRRRSRIDRIHRPIMPKCSTSV